VTEGRELGWSGRVGLRPIENGENAPNHILTKGSTEGQGDLLSDPWTPPRRISLFHGDDRVHHFLWGHFGPSLFSTLDENSRRYFRMVTDDLPQNPLHAIRNGQGGIKRGWDPYPLPWDLGPLETLFLQIFSRSRTR
jgi:hypothetical protein